MINVNILLYGKVKQVDVYESMFEYIKGSDISNLEVDYTEGRQEYFVEKWQPGQDKDTFCEYDERQIGEIEIDGRKYIRINRGETEVNYVPADSLAEILYVIYYCDHNLKKCTCIGEVFPTEEEAEKRAKELRRK
jgi:hypothetical protein